MAGRSDEWRQPLAGQQQTAPLLRRRGRRALAIHVPLGATGVENADSAVVYTGTVAVACARPAPVKPSSPASAPVRAAPASRSSAPQASQRLATPPTTHEQPAKRHCSQLSCANQAAAYVAGPSAAQALYTTDCVVVVGFAPSHPTPSQSWEFSNTAPNQPNSSRPDSCPAQQPIRSHLAAGCMADCGGRGSSPMSSWLEKIRSMLSPAASRPDVALVC
ncbi:hypothetical protein D9Q98_001246 [Chlorella vulgaris]|uniref:Uncharacterized protein n=1 Tax=Chlorella vulgaris TaxID=3077 RepID=A0A9D4TZJ0_CHLVU|nr:hypothetical protein D9Q98_001246 [Chlorella vulgaris]